MADESKIEDIAAAKEAADEVIAEGSNDVSTNAHVESEDEEEDHDETEAGPSTGASATPAAKKKKSKRKRIKAALTGGLKTDKKPTEADVHKAVSGLSNDQVSELLAMNPSLARELGVEDGTSVEKASEALKKLNLQDIMTGLAASGKNVKDMGSYKFWQTQPVPRLDEKPNEDQEEGPIKIIDPDKVSKEPPPLMEGFEWVTVDVTKEEDLNDLFELLNGHYVEDEESMFRFSYSKAFFQWALMSPGWKKEWHVGVRASKSQKLVAFISGVPVDLRVRNKVLKATEVNFLNVHKKLRSKRLAPVLIKEITRRCYLNDIYQAIYTAGVVLPTPVSTCRYFHRSLDWQKLYDVGFSPLPPNSKPSYQISKFRLPEHTAIKGLRPMEPKDIDAVLDLLRRYLARFDMAPVFTRDEVEHWLLPKVGGSSAEQVIFSYVVEDTATKKITDYISFYSLASTVIGHPKHEKVNAAYLYYYATETAFQNPKDKSALKVRLNELVHDALIIAKRFKFDVFNSLTLMDNGLFLEQQKFGKGDGQLHFYVYNYRANPIAGGVDKRNEVDENHLSGVGIVML